MRKRIVLGLAGVALAATAVVPAVAAPSAPTAVPSYPPPCPLHPLLQLSNNTAYISVGCTTVAVPVPLSIKRPG